MTWQPDSAATNTASAASRLVRLAICRLMRRMVLMLRAGRRWLRTTLNDFRRVGTPLNDVCPLGYLRGYLLFAGIAAGQGRGPEYALLLYRFLFAFSRD